MHAWKCSIPLHVSRETEILCLFILIHVVFCVRKQWRQENICLFCRTIRLIDVASVYFTCLSIWSSDSFFSQLSSSFQAKLMDCVTCRGVSHRNRCLMNTNTQFSNSLTRHNQYSGFFYPSFQRKRSTMSFMSFLLENFNRRKTDKYETIRATDKKRRIKPLHVVARLEM